MLGCFLVVLNVMNMFLFSLGLLAGLFLIFLIAKSQRGRTYEEIDWDAHNLQTSEEGGDLRVLAGGHNYLNKGIRREAFLQQYREAWNRVRLNFEPLVIGDETVAFTPGEQLYLRQKIVLSWIYAYNVNGRRFKFLFWSMGSDNRRDVLRAAEAKYGAKTEKAITLAAHTLNMNDNKFKAWLKSDEEFLSRW